MNVKMAKKNAVSVLRWSQKYFKTDMLYATKGFSWLLTEKVGQLTLSFLTLTAFANFIPKEVYGTYQYIYSVVAIMAIFTLSELKTAVVRAMAREKEGTPKLAVKESIKWGLLGSLGLVGVAGWYFLHHDTTLALAFVVCAVLLPLWGGFNFFEQFWQGRKQFNKKAVYSISVSVFSTAVMIATLYFTNNVVLLIGAFFFSVGISNAVALTLAMKRAKNDVVDREAISFGKHLVIMGIIQNIASQLDKIIVWQFLGPLQVATYTFAKDPIKKIRDAFFIRQLALPKLSERAINQERKRGVVTKFFRLFGITIPMAIVVIIITPFVYQIFFPEYLSSIPYFQALALLIALTPFGLFNVALIAEFKKKQLYIIQTAVPLLRIVSFFVFIPLWGIWGLVWATVGIELFQGLVFSYYFYTSI
jgi:O-antigen/teichoic acid export membrane protein